MCANYFRKHFDSIVIDQIGDVLKDYDTGCVMLNFPSDLSEKDYVLIATAVSHLVSVPIAEPSGDFYGITTVKHNDAPPFKILDPYRVFALHTDGIFMDNPVDWLMMMKMAESNAIGGESRLLHMADFAEFDELLADPLGSTIFDFGLEQKDRRFDVFSRVSDMKCGKAQISSEKYGQRFIKFVDQFILPRSLDEADYIDRVQKALENSSGIQETSLGVVSMIILNNNFRVHGRSAFARNAGLSRSLLRQYGYFEGNHPYGY